MACASVGARRAWDDEAAGASDGVAVWPSRCTEGCWDEACCSFPAGPVAVLAGGDGRRLGDAGGESSSALGASPTSVSHGHDGRSHANSGRKIPAHPYLVRQRSDFGFWQTLEVRTLGCAEISPLPIYVRSSRAN